MRIVFAGTPEFACPSLEALAKKHEICAVLTAPDLPSGRGRSETPSPISDLAASLGIRTLKFPRLGSEARRAVLGQTPERAPELLVAVAYGRIFGPKFLGMFPGGGLNVHPSLLPLYRGPAPIPAAILAGEKRTGVTVQEIALEMDAGDIIVQEPVALNGEETTGSLTQSLAVLGAGLLLEAVELVEKGSARPVPQDEDAATYCPLIRKEAGLIEWALPAQQIARMVRAYTPWPAAYTFLGDRRLTILSASADPGDIGKVGDAEAVAPPGTVVDVDKNRGILVQTGSGTLAVDYLQLQSKKAHHFRDFLNGQPGGLKAFRGVKLGSSG